MIFENCGCPALDEISQALVQGLPDLLGNPRASNRRWTYWITAVLCEMGKKRPGTLVCCRGFGECGEWLLDVVWMGREQQEILLAVESEWGRPGDVEDDFVKLLSIKACRKLLIFGSIEKDSAGIIKGLESRLLKHPYHVEGEEYMALNVTKDKALRYTFTVPHDGRLDPNSVTFVRGKSLKWPWAPAA